MAGSGAVDQTVSSAVEQFNASPFTGINAFFEARLLRRDAKAVALFLKLKQYVLTCLAVGHIRVPRWHRCPVPKPKDWPKVTPRCCPGCVTCTSSQAERPHTTVALKQATYW